MPRKSLMIDRRNEVPDLACFLPNHQFVTDVKHVPLEPSIDASDPLRVVAKISGVDNFYLAGTNGPPKAAFSSAENEGVPGQNLFGVPFGRDGERIAGKLFPFVPLLMRATQLYFAREQGVEFNRQREEEVGKILHEKRDPTTDSIAREITSKSGWEWPYFGTIDATPLFISNTLKYCRESDEGVRFLGEKFIGRDGKERTMATALDRSLQWLVGKLKSNNEGLLESKPMFETSLSFHGWQDSWDSCHHADGAVANTMGGVATIENQALAHSALTDAAEFFDLHKKTIQSNYSSLETPKTTNLTGIADNLEHQIWTNMWDEENGYFVLGTDRNAEGALRRMNVLKSNAGHTLLARFMQGDNATVVERRKRLIENIFSQMLGPAGIQTEARGHGRYSPYSYHNGSTWIFDSGIIAEGLRINGDHILADELDSRHMKAFEATGMLAEFFNGEGQRPRVNGRIVIVEDTRHNGFKYKAEQPPQRDQGWTAAEIAALKLRQAQDKDLSHGRSEMMDAEIDFQMEVLQRLPQAA